LSFDHHQKRCSHELAARNFYVEIIKIVALLKTVHCGGYIASTLLVYIRQSRGFSLSRRRTCCFSRLRLGRNRGNVPETGSNEDSNATTFVRITDSLRACSIYWVYLYAVSLSLHFPIFLVYIQTIYFHFKMNKIWNNSVRAYFKSSNLLKAE